LLTLFEFETCELRQTLGEGVILVFDTMYNYVDVPRWITLQVTKGRPWLGVMWTEVAWKRENRECTI
jgi:hypothetical protein